MDTVLHLFTYLQDLSKTNQLLATAIGVWGMGMVTLIFKGVPMGLWQRIKRQLTTTLYMNNATIGNNNENFSAFIEWFEGLKWAKWSRSISINGAYTDSGLVIGVGDGNHFFMYKGRFFYMNRKRMENTGQGYSNNINYEVIITALTRSRKLMEEFIEEFRFRPRKDRLNIYAWKGQDWTRLAGVTQRELKTVVINKQTKQELVDLIEKFQHDREWYARRGLPYKMTFLIYGPPGTGKTSLLHALASHFKYNICRINMSEMTDNSLELSFARTPPRSMILIEDFDSTSATKARKKVMKAPSDTPALEVNGQGKLTLAAPTAAEEKSDDVEQVRFLTLSGILNALQGIVPLDDRLIFMTTNTPQEVDPAIVRKGRVDHHIELNALADAEVREYIELMFPGTDTTELGPFADILGCDLQALYFDHRDNVHAFIQSIPSQTPARTALHAV